MATSTHLLIIALNTWTKFSNQKTGMAKWVNKRRLNYMFPGRDPFQISEHTQTKSEKMQKNFSCKWKLKESWNSYTNIRQNKI